MKNNHIIRQEEKGEKEKCHYRLQVGGGLACGCISLKNGKHNKIGLKQYKYGVSGKPLFVTQALGKNLYGREDRRLPVLNSKSERSDHFSLLIEHNTDFCLVN